MADSERVTFTRPSADRIARAVRRIESGDRELAPLRYDARSPSPYTFRVATFTGGWTKGSSKTVTLRIGSTSNAINLFADIATATATRNCAIAKDGTAWYLIAAEC